MNLDVVHGARTTIRAIAEKHGISVGHLLGPGRSFQLVEVRLEAARQLRDAGMSYPEIGLALRRDHSTIHALLKGSAAARRAREKAVVADAT